MMNRPTRWPDARPTPLRGVLVMAFATFLSALPLTAQAQGITELGTLGGSASEPYGVSANGAVVVGSAAASNFMWHAFRWTNNVMTDLGTLGGGSSFAYGVSANGAVVVGWADTADDANRAFRWTNNVMTDLGTFGGSYSEAYGVSADGTVVVGWAGTAGQAPRAFRWINNVMTDLGTLGGTSSTAYGVSANGAVVVGSADTAAGGSHAFRWTNNVMTDLGTLGGAFSEARSVSADGTVVVGWANTAGGGSHAFRWTNNIMTDLGTFGVWPSSALGVSADGAVVVGSVYASAMLDRSRGFRWTQATSMQTIEDWLRAGGVPVVADIISSANATNSDGSVVVGGLDNGNAYIARVSNSGSGLVTLADVQTSLAGTASGGSMALTTAGTLLNGAHGRPLLRRVAAGQKTFWMAGDWGTDDHGSRSGDLGLAEVGFGHHLGWGQVNLSLGQTWAQQRQVLNGHAETEGAFLQAEALFPLGGNLWATLGGYGHWGQADLKRGYLNAAVQSYSIGKPDVNTWALRARLDWEDAWQAAGAAFTPYADLSYAEAKLDAFTETGGGFPARFDARRDKTTELRIGVSATRPLADGMNLLGTVEVAHRFEKNGPRTSGQVVGLFGFDLAGADTHQDWLRAGIGVEGRLAGGRASLSLNLTSRGETQSAWLAANWQKVF